ncbi:MAG: (d)CMP kinase [Symbiobacteriaceae bacterium]|nr:(d)CMP kinase [Symbiobacteriaceae bacterium]
MHSDTDATPLGIAIDGPAGAGKSTIATLLARRLGIAYLNTGAMYRSLAWLALRQKVSWEDESGLVTLLKSGDLHVVASHSETRIYYNDYNITPELASAEVGEGASQVSVHAAVRQDIVAWQQQYAATHDAVLEGRDIGTVVLPQADLKIFLTASPRVRAERRFTELKEKGLSTGYSLEDIEREIIQRDQRDSNREIGALRQAEDAILINSDKYSALEIVESILNLLMQRGNLSEEV